MDNVRTKCVLSPPLPHSMFSRVRDAFAIPGLCLVFGLRAGVGAWYEGKKMLCT